jgi:hypothetical protein
MIADSDFKVSKLYGMLPAATSGDPTKRTPADNQTVRNVFVIGPDKKVKLVLVYPMTTGRNFDEVLRVIDSLQLTAKHKVATPVNWQQGEDVIIAGAGLEGAEALSPHRPAAEGIGSAQGSFCAQAVTTAAVAGAGPRSSLRTSRRGCVMPASRRPATHPLATAQNQI